LLYTLSLHDALPIFLKYGAFYDSLVAAAQKNPDEDGYLAPDVVNEIIKDMREVIKKYVDVDLKAVYTVFESQKDQITEEEWNELNETLDYLEYESLNEEEEILGRVGDFLFGKRKGADQKQKLTKTQSAKFQKTAGEKNVASDRVKGLESNRLPLILTTVGAALGALGWIAQTEWFKELVTTVTEYPDQYGEKEILKIVSKNVKVDPNGWSYTIQNNGFMQETGLSLNYNQPIDNLKKAFAWYGGGDEKKGVEIMSQFLNPNAQGASMNDLVKQLSNPANKTVGDIFNHMEGTWGDKLLYNQNAGAVQPEVAITNQSVVFKSI
jgi:septum formation topological specificity factor MinE